MTVDMTTYSNDTIESLIIAGFSSFFSSPQDAALLQQLTQFVEQQILSDVPMDEIIINLKNQQMYKDRFAGNEGLKAAGLTPLSEYEYLQLESRYAETLRNYGLNNLATRDTFSKLIGGNVSAAELQDRVVNVYDRIRNADDALSKELQSLRESFNVSESDLASAILTGSTGAEMLKRKIAEAEISAEATTRGLTSAMGVQELARLGVTRQDARQGFEAVKQMQGSLEKLGGIYGTNTAGLQKELEQEQFTGLLSKRRKNLMTKETQTFSGKSGALTGQGIKQTSGQV